jgi:prolyl oligopeptidase
VKHVRSSRPAGARGLVRKLLRMAVLLILGITSTTMAQPTPPDDDPHLWLEDVLGERPLAWVRERNTAARQALEPHPRFASLRERLRAALDSPARIPQVTRRGGHLWNFWRDEQHPRGVWRRTTLAEYRKPQPRWQTLIDLDALAAAEGENWVWAGAQCLGPAYRRCLVSLSRGGADATVVREIDLVDGRFVPGGFQLPEAKSDVEWVDADTLLVGTDVGPGSMTDSGYPRIIKRWRRGQPLAEATTLFEGQPGDVAAWAWVDRTPGHERIMLGRSPDFYRSHSMLLQGDRLVQIDKPDDAQLSFWRQHVLLRLRSDWTVAGTTHRGGSLLLADAAAYLAGQRRFTTLFTPSATSSLQRWSTTRRAVMLDVLDNVAGRLEAWSPDAKGRWQRQELEAPFPGRLSVTTLHDPMVARDPWAESYLVNYADFLTPDTLLLGRLGRGGLQPLKSQPAFFDSQGMRVEQLFATSRDGTRVPYFVVWPRGAKADGRNPTLLYGYGGFEVAQKPWYSAAYGSAWTGQGGVLVVANIRGGGEYGPAWHLAAVKQHKQRSYDDFIAVAEDLVARRITSPRQLGIQGGSNGGLLVGAVMLQRPDLFGAVVCQVPLLDMRRYHKLLAGASWMAEYGDPDQPDEWAWISAYSPYQNVRRGMKLPPLLLTTSTRDDRVHPGHARKMAARMAEQGHEVLTYENIEGGHGGAADNAQKADLLALEFSFLWQKLAPTVGSR